MEERSQSEPPPRSVSIIRDNDSGSDSDSDSGSSSSSGSSSGTRSTRSGSFSSTSSSGSSSSSSSSSGSDSDDGIKTARAKRVRATQAAEIPSPSKRPRPAETNVEEKREEINPADLALLQKLRSSGTYVPPHRLAHLRSKITDKSSKEYQRLSWDALRKGINGVVNKVNVTNISDVIPELFQLNLVRGKGLFVRAVMKAQSASPGFTNVYASIVAVVNTKLPEIGELLLNRIILQFRRCIRRADRPGVAAACTFVGHLVNQQIAHEILALQLLTFLLETPTEGAVAVAASLTKDVGMYLTEICPQGVHAIFERLRVVLQEGDADARTQYIIEDLFDARKSNFAEYPTKIPELDLVRSKDQITHDLALDDEDLDKDDALDVFRLDPNYEKTEEMWNKVKKRILGDDSGSDSDSSTDSEAEDSGTEADDESEDGDAEEVKEDKQQGTAPSHTQTIKDFTEADLVAMRRTIYLTIMSSIDFEECTHKLMGINIPETLEMELINMLVECCSQERTYQRYYGLLGRRLCTISRAYQEATIHAFEGHYATIHRFETNQLRNVAMLYAHLLSTDALPWTVFECIHMNEDETTSSSRIFIKVLCQELATRLWTCHAPRALCRI